MINLLRYSLMTLTTVAVLGVLFSCKGDAEEKVVEKIVEYRDRPSASVEGEVAVPQDLPGYGVVVYAEGSSYAAYTDENGAYLLSGLPEGEFRLRATRHDLVDIFIGTVNVTDAKLNEAQPSFFMQRILMEARPELEREPVEAMIARNFGGVRGQVRTDAPGDEGGVLVVVQGHSARTATLPGGSYEIQRLEPGNYVLEFSKPGYQRQTLPVAIAAGQTTEVPPVSMSGGGAPRQTGRTVYGRVEVLTASGEPLADYSNVRVALEGSSFSATPNSVGRFEIRNIPPGPYTVAANAPGYLLEDKVQVDLRNVTAAEAVLTLLEDTTEEMAKGTIIGRVVLEEPGSSGNGGVAVSLVGTNNVIFTDQEGRFEMTGVDEGTYDLMATMNGYENGLEENVEVKALEITRVRTIVLRTEQEAPTVVLTSPGDKAKDVVIEQPTTVMIQFSTKMNPSSVRRAVTITPEVGWNFRPAPGPGAGPDVYYLLLNAVPKDNAAALRYGTEYRVTIGTEAQSLEGTPMKESYKFSFTTGYPMIIATVPTDGSDEAMLLHNEHIWVYFNAPIDPESIDADDISFSPALFGQPILRFKRDQETGWTQMQIQGRAEYGTRYRVRISSGVRTVTGQRVQNTPYTWSFKTRDLMTYDEYYGTGNLDYDPAERERQRQ